jgi:hypothetical protein
MKVHVLFAQRKGSYSGQYGLEALAVMSEADMEANSDYLPTTLEENRRTGEFESLGIVTLWANEADILRRLEPDKSPVPAAVVTA